ncbi:type 1 glutamine amidotransferase domain-containing protein [Roseibium limicola]|uniref:Type 1 glutamine amidotransferase n=1 Tax=Roseibium limicola TaxID=2816037 RepID=A0A939EMJ2_9HYPH|nr:type 1 glutamine amidotransferase domain-containing protein [Roseibium limicola]MBO0345326.1 type 1 glutamine amidotransferase [Roseibium limicola]
MPKITDAKILIISTHGFEQSELEYPRDELRKAGAVVHVATPDGEAIKGWDKDNWGNKADADLKLTQAAPADYDAVVLPGGQINPDLLRVNDDALALIRSFVHNGKTVAAICHAPWLLAEVGALNGREATSYKSIKTDIENAGAKWRDQEVVCDNGIVTSRSPEDLQAFVAKIIEEIEEGEHKRKAA